MSAAAPGVTVRRIDLDTSAYLCILLGENGASRLSAETDGAELLSSVRTAIWFHTEQPISRFVTMDTAQAQAASELALPV